MSEEKIVFQCDHIGVAGITDVHVRSVDGKYKARVGIAIMGSTNMSDEELKAINYDPFHDGFQDNYCEGLGATVEEAISALKLDMKQMADSFWAM